MPPERPPFVARAQEHLARRVPIFPVNGKVPIERGGFHVATTDPAQIEEWGRLHPNADVAMPTGRVTGCVILDVDPRNGGDEALHELEQQHAALPDTVRALTPSGGFHSLFQYPDQVEHVPSSNSKLGPGLDIKTDGGYVVVPPAAGYQWDAAAHPEDLERAPLPDWFLAAILDAANVRAPATAEADVAIPEGRRNSTLTSLGGSMRRPGMTQAAIEAALLEENRQRCEPPLPDEEVRRIAHSVTRYRPAASASVASVASSRLRWENSSGTSRRARSGGVCTNPCRRGSRGS